MNLQVLNNNTYVKNNSKNTKISQTNNFKQNVSFNGGAHQLLQDVLTITGTQTKAKIFTNNVNYQTLGQIKTICSHPVFADVPVRIMPDTHAGKTAVVGFTAPISKTGAIIPNLINGDIGCGMLCVKFDTQGREIDFDKLDEFIRSFISTSRTERLSGMKKYLQPIESKIRDLCKYKYKQPEEKVTSSLGTIGGGNHFIEIDTSANGETYLVIHTGSRHFGKEVHNHFEKIATQQNPYRIRDLSYLTGAEAKEYLEDLKIAAQYSQINRKIIADAILKNMGWKEIESFESIHNYVGNDNIIRKGAISAKDGERVIIPLNMRDGAIIARGKGNPDWNFSAPHGAGRQFSRSEASELISLEEYQQSMKNIYSNSISQATVDESPQAYKDANEIIQNITDTAEIETIIRPTYNFKD